MIKNLTKEQKEEFSSIFDDMGKSLDISQSQYETITQSYQAVGKWLSEGELIKALKPEIRPQGSFMLGTAIKPINENDDIDIDLVCELQNKPVSWTQYDLKQAIGKRIKENALYAQMLEKQNGGRRCWTLLYRQNAEAKEQYHLDILPCIVSSNYHIILEKSFSNNVANYEPMAIRITDNKSGDYHTSTNVDTWLKSNPFGYAQWFFQKAIHNQTKLFSIQDSIQPVPQFQNSKYPLQRIVQILKRHRDIMFNGDENKPISIIITTLAAKAYKGESNILEGLYNVVHSMKNHIEDRNGICWVANPVNAIENFADKWEDEPKKKANFLNWILKVQADIDSILSSNDMFSIQNNLEKPFGKELITETFSTRAKRMKELRDKGFLKMSSVGVLGSVTGQTVKPHTFFGNDAKK